MTDSSGQTTVYAFGTAAEMNHKAGKTVAQLQQLTYQHLEKRVIVAGLLLRVMAYILFKRTNVE